MKTRLLFFFACLLIFLEVSSCRSQVSFGYVNSNKLVQDYHGTAMQHAAFVIKAKVWQQRVDSLSHELASLQTASTASHISQEQQLMRYRDAVQQQAQQENQRLTQSVLNEINAYIKQYGKEKGYIFIFGATESGNIVYAAEGTDISDDVLKGLNEQYDLRHPNTLIH